MNLFGWFLAITGTATFMVCVAAAFCEKWGIVVGTSLILFLISLIVDYFGGKRHV